MAYSQDGFTEWIRFSLNNFTFKKRVNLLSVQSQGSFEFNRCLLEKGMHIYNSQFAGTLKFDRCIFSDSFKMNRVRVLNDGDLIFRDNEFLSHFQIHGCNVAMAAAFYFTIFKGEVRFSNSIANEGWYFLVIDFSRAERVRIHDLDFSNSYFWSSRIGTVDFFEITWKSDDTRYIIGDEMVAFGHSKAKHYLREKPRLIDVENLYMQLVSNFERNGLYTESGKFYISAMEMRRKNKRNWFTQNMFCVEAWYRLVSNYGQSATKALVCILITFFIFSLLLTDLRLWTTSSPGTLVKCFIDSAMANFVILVNPPDLNFDSVSSKYFMVGLERTTLAVLVTLYILALRRRFKRS